MVYVREGWSVSIRQLLGVCVDVFFFFFFIFFFQAEDGIRYLVRSRGLGDVYKRQALSLDMFSHLSHFLS